MWYTVKKQHKPFPKDFLWGASTFAYQCEGVANIQKELYQQSHHMMLAQARAMAFCHEMMPGAKIGPAPNISAVYPASCKPEDITAAMDDSTEEADPAVFDQQRAASWPLTAAWRCWGTAPGRPST